MNDENNIFIIDNKDYKQTKYITKKCLSYERVLFKLWDCFTVIITSFKPIKVLQLICANKPMH